MISDAETKALGLMMAVIMFGLGATLRPADFLQALRRPSWLGIGLLSTYLLTPLLGLALAWGLGLSPALATGLALLACLPGGSTSNLFVYYARADLSLSILLTLCSTLVAVLMVPLTLAWTSRWIPTAWQIPPQPVAQVLGLLLLPTLAGMALRARSPLWAARVERIGAWLGVAVLAFLVLSWLPRNHELLTSAPWTAHAAALGLGLGGFAIGYALARVLRQGRHAARTVALETGIQNGALGGLIILLSVPKALQAEVLLIPLLYAHYILLCSAALACGFRYLGRREDAAAY